MYVVGDDQPFDVFLSYRHAGPEGVWVRNELLGSLRSAGLKVFIDIDCFRLGVPLVTEMARAVEQSRFTLAVLSPAYLRSQFTELESVLAEHLGLETARRRLIAVMRIPCRPRLGLRARLWLDMTPESDFTAATGRLIRELKGV